MEGHWFLTASIYYQGPSGYFVVVLLRGHSTTKWTELYPILTTYPPQVDILNTTLHVTKRGLPSDQPPGWCTNVYHKIKSIFMSYLEASSMFYRLFMK